MKSSTTEGDGDVKQRRRETSNANLLGDGHTHTHTCACTHVHACGFRCPKSESVNMTRNTELQKERFGDGDTKPLWPTPAPHAVTTAQAKKKKALALPRMKHAAKLTTHPTNFASTFRDEREMKACVYDVVHPLPSPPSLSPRASLCQHPPLVRHPSRKRAPKQIRATVQRRRWRPTRRGGARKGERAGKG